MSTKDARSILDGLRKKRSAVQAALENTPEKQLQVLDSEIRTAEQLLADEVESKRVEDLAKAMERAKIAHAAVIVKAGELRETLKALQAVKVEVVGLRGSVNTFSDGGLNGAVERAFEYWKAVDPVLVGLPARTKESERRADLEARIAQADTVIGETKAAMKSFTGSNKKPFKELISTWEHDRARCQAELEGKPMPPDPVVPAEW